MLTATERRNHAAWRQQIETDLADHQRRYTVAHATIQLLAQSPTRTDDRVDRLRQAEQDLDWSEQQIAECRFKLSCPVTLTRILWDPSQRDRLVQRDILHNQAPLGAGGVSCS